MALLTKVAEVGGFARALREEARVVIYETTTPLAAAGVFNTPHSSLRPHLYSDPPQPGDFVQWGEATHFRVTARSDQASAVSGLTVHYTNDGVNEFATPLLSNALVADTDFDSGWIPVAGLGGRLSLTNGGTDQTELRLRMELAKEVLVNT